MDSVKFLYRVAEEYDAMAMSPNHDGDECEATARRLRAAAAELAAARTKITEGSEALHDLECQIIAKDEEIERLKARDENSVTVDELVAPVGCIEERNYLDNARLDIWDGAFVLEDGYAPVRVTITPLPGAAWREGE